MRINRWHIYMMTLLAMALMTSCRQSASLTKVIPGHDNTVSSSAHSISPEQQTRFNYFFLEAVRQSENNKNAAAFDLLQHCRKINPCAPEVDYSLSQFYVALKDTANALKCLESAYANAPDNTDYAEDLAITYIHYKDYSKAIDVYQHILEKTPERSDLLENLFMLYSQNDDYDNMIATLNKIELFEGKSEKISEEKFRIYVNQNKPKKAFEEMESLANTYPNDLRYRVVMGKMLLANGSEKAGLDMINTVLKKEPDNISAKMAMLDYYKEKGEDSLFTALQHDILISKSVDTDDKISIMRSIVADNEQNGGDSTKILNLFRNMLSQSSANVANADLASMMASYMIAKKMSADSISPVLHKIIQISPDNAFARLQLISYAWSKKNYDDVISLCTPALQYNPEEMAFYYYMGLAYDQKNQSDKTLEIFQKGLSTINSQSDPDIVSDFYAVMGDILHEKGREQESYAAYDSCLQWKDDNVGCLNNYAYYLSVKGKNLSKAEQMSFKTVKKEPNNSTFLDTYAWILFQQSRYEEAKIYIEQAVSHDSDSSAVIVEHAGDIYAMNKEMDKAMDCWKKAAKSATDNKLLLRKIKYKKYIRE